MSEQAPAKFLLFEHQVPSKPTANTEWCGVLRWMICVMNHDDASMHFIASVLAHCLKNGHLTDRQDKAATKILKRVCWVFDAGVLDCQLNESPTSVFRNDLDPKGRLQ